MKQAVIIVAGGSGMRMGNVIPKQFLLLAGKPVLMHTITRFYLFNASMPIIVTLPAAHVATWKQLCCDYQFELPHIIVCGGETRFQSVKNALTALPEPALVAVHDGVRPLVSESTIAHCFEVAAASGSAIPVVPVLDSLRAKAPDGSSYSVAREAYCVVQTPQIFRADWLRAAYELPYRASFTDDAAVVEAAGYKITLAEGSRMNLKITEPLDLQIAEALYSKQINTD